MLSKKPVQDVMLSATWIAGKFRDVSDIHISGGSYHLEPEQDIESDGHHDSYETIINVNPSTCL